MSYDKIQPIPPIFPSYGNLPTSYQVSLSYPEELHDLRVKVNQILINLNTFTAILKTIENNYNTLNNQIELINSEIESINNYFPTFKNEITISVNAQLESLFSRVLQLMNDYQNIFTGQLTDVENELNDRIDEIELGNVKAYNPTNGEIENISKVIMDVYDTLRYNSITVTEFETLDLTATEFDSKQITAFNFDVNGKVILLN